MRRELRFSLETEEDILKAVSEWKSWATAFEGIDTLEDINNEHLGNPKSLRKMLESARSNAKRVTLEEAQALADKMAGNGLGIAIQLSGPPEEVKASLDSALAKVKEYVMKDNPELAEQMEADLRQEAEKAIAEQAKKDWRSVLDTFKYPKKDDSGE